MASRGWKRLTLKVNLAPPSFLRAAYISSPVWPILWSLFGYPVCDHYLFSVVATFVNIVVFVLHFILFLLILTETYNDAKHNCVKHFVKQSFSSETNSQSDRP